MLATPPGSSGRKEHVHYLHPIGNGVETLDTSRRSRVPTHQRHAAVHAASTLSGGLVVVEPRERVSHCG